MMAVNLTLRLFEPGTGNLLLCHVLRMVVLPKIQLYKTRAKENRQDYTAIIVNLS